MYKTECARDTRNSSQVVIYPYARIGHGAVDSPLHYSNKNEGGGYDEAL